MDDRHPIEASEGTEEEAARAQEAPPPTTSEPDLTASVSSASAGLETDARPPSVVAREESLAEPDIASVSTATAPDDGLPPLAPEHHTDTPDASPAAESPPSTVPPDETIAATAERVEETIDRMHDLVAEVREAMSDPAHTAVDLVESVCDEEKLHAHAPELDQMLTELLGGDETPSAEQPVPSADEALAAVESAMTSLSEATDPPAAPAPDDATDPDAVTSAAPTETTPEPTLEPTLESPVETPIEAAAKAEPEAVPAPVAEDTPSEPESLDVAQTPDQLSSEPNAAPETAAVAEPATPAADLAPEPVQQVVAVVAAQPAAEVRKPVADAAPTAPPPDPAPPAIGFGKRLSTSVGAGCASASLLARRALTGFATLVPAKFRMLVGIAAATMLLWVPVVWMMAKMVASNDRIRPLTEAELHALVEETHAEAHAASGAGDDSHGAKKDDGHGAKKDDGHGAKKDDGHGAKKDEKKPDQKAKKADKKQEKKKDDGHGGGH